MDSDRDGLPHPDPPPHPTNIPYTACYCEENVYLLGQALLLSSPDHDIYAVVISNPTKSVALWHQRLGSPEHEFLVVWDYHVVLVLVDQLGARAWVYDADSRLGSPCNWSRYVEQTFKSHLIEALDARYRCTFRVVPIAEYIARFASDRSHMLRPRNLDLETEAADEEVEWIAPPPSYPPIAGPSATERNNLMSHFVDVTNERGYGTVLSDVAFLKDARWMRR